MTYDEPLFHVDPDDILDANRYASARGWEPKDPHKKLREKALKEIQESLSDPGTALRSMPAGQWTTSVGGHAGSTQLAGTLWHSGELALLFGPRGVGKSVLAVQLAESIAHGGAAMADERWAIENGSNADAVADPECHTPHPAIPDKKVLYVDLQRTAAQWAERYSAPSWVPGHIVRHRFSPNLIRAELDLILADREEYLKDRRRYVQASIEREIEAVDPAVLIVDDLMLGGAGVETAAGFARTMQTLKYWAAEYSISVLAVVPSKQRHRPAAVTLADIASGRNIASLADTVFCLAPSTFAPEIRYLKHLASPREIVHTAENLITFQLVRMDDGQLTGETLGPEPTASVSPDSSAAFLGLQFLGPSTEHDHLRDYAAESAAAGRAHEKTTKRLAHRSSTAALVDGILDGSYLRYLKGEK